MHGIKTMNYKVLSRKYRPQTFSEIIGQSHVVSTLINSIKSNRIAHGYLLAGLRGVGKTTTARVLSKTLNCKNKDSQNPCNKCQNCIEITESRSLDVIELDGASNRGIDEIREIKETVKYPPISSEYKIFIIDEVHMLTKEAFNALLKTLEEPPANVIFILATTDSYKIPDTILSRTLRFDFKKVLNQEISTHMKNILEKEKIDFEEAALDLISFKADGSIRDALSVLDKIISYSDQVVSYSLVKESLGIIENSVYLKLLESIFKSDQENLLIELKIVIDSGYSIDNFISGFNLFLSDCLLCSSGYENKNSINQETIDWINSNKSSINSIDIMRIIEEVQKYELNSKYLLQPEIALESLFVKLSVMDTSIKISDLLNKIVLDTENKSSEKKSDKVKQDRQQPSDQIAEKKDVYKNLITNEANKEKNQKSSKELAESNKNHQNEDLNEKYKEIIDLIEKEDKRVSHSLDDANLKIRNKVIVVELGKESNSYVEKILNDNKSLIQNATFEVMGNQLDIEIISNFETEDSDENKDHPLLDTIKEKFDSRT